MQYAELVKETLGWMLNELRDEAGGFYSAQDADSSEGEGVYYTWNPLELQEVLGEEQGELFSKAFQVTRNGNFEGRTILSLHPGAISTEKERDSIEESKRKLYRVRLGRPRPATDTKVLTSWNGLAISALAFAGAVLDEPSYSKSAAAATEFILEKCSRQGRLLRRFAGGEAGLEGTLEDYSFFINGLIDLFETTSEPRWLEEAVRLAWLMMKDYDDNEYGGFFLSLRAEPVRLKESYDGPTPSGNSMAILALIRLAELTGESSFKDRAEAALGYFSRDLEQQPSAHTCMLIGLDLLLNGVKEVVVTARTSAEAKPMKKEVFESFIPNRVLLVANAQTYPALSGLTSLLEDRKPGARAQAFVCQNFACKLPANSVDVLREQLDAK
jgi:uncharacterized protein YyaL (SSP411 family)